MPTSFGTRFRQILRDQLHVMQDSSPRGRLKDDKYWVHRRYQLSFSLFIRKFTWIIIILSKQFYCLLRIIINYMKTILLCANKWLLLKRNNYLKPYKILVLDRNTWNHTAVSKLFVLDKNTRYHTTVLKNNHFKNNYTKYIIINIQWMWFSNL